jgi:hypothetical protein
MAGRVLPIRRAAVRKLPRHYNPPAVPAPTKVPRAPTWRTGDRVRWQGYTGQFLRDMGNGQAEVIVGAGIYCVPVAELRAA